MYTLHKIIRFEYKQEPINTTDFFQNKALAEVLDIEAIKDELSERGNIATFYSDELKIALEKCEQLRRNHYTDKEVISDLPMAVFVLQKMQREAELNMGTVQYYFRRERE
jgi:hypothetical protein